MATGRSLTSGEGETLDMSVMTTATTALAVRRHGTTGTASRSLAGLPCRWCCCLRVLAWCSASRGGCGRVVGRLASTRRSRLPHPRARHGQTRTVSVVGVNASGPSVPTARGLPPATTLPLGAALVQPASDGVVIQALGAPGPHLGQDAQLPLVRDELAVHGCWLRRSGPTLPPRRSHHRPRLRRTPSISR